MAGFSSYQLTKDGRIVCKIHCFGCRTKVWQKDHNIHECVFLASLDQLLLMAELLESGRTESEIERYQRRFDELNNFLDRFLKK